MIKLSKVTIGGLKMKPIFEKILENLKKTEKTEITINVTLP
jgi:hypothetical protein